MFPLQELPLIIQALIASVFGLIVGSFLNVVIYRVPQGESIAFPASHCGSCGKAVKPYDNIPLLSYAILRGRCRFCKETYSWRYPAVELLVGLLFFAVVYQNGLTWLSIARVIFVAIIVALTFIDAEHFLLPDVITYPALLFAIVSTMAISFWMAWNDLPWITIRSWLPPSIAGSHFPYWFGLVAIALAVPTLWLVDRIENVLFGKYFEFTEEEETEADRKLNEKWEKQRRQVIFFILILGVIAQIVWWFAAWKRIQPATIVASYTLLQSIVGAIIGGGVVWVLRAAFFYLRGIEGMGLGDIKLMAVIGAFLGWDVALLVIFFGTLLGSIVGGIAALRSKEGMKLRLPFGLPLGISAILAIFYGHSLIQWYVQMLP